MSGDAIAQGVGLLAALVLVGSAVLARGRRGEPVMRHALIWAGVLALAFAVAWWIEHDA